MREKIQVPSDHPRAESIRLREKLIHHHGTDVVATAGLIAHGRGEAFDYLIGEQTPQCAIIAIRAAAAALLLAEHPVFSVNGNVAALVAEDVVRVARIIGAKIEVNLFYRSPKRERAIEKVLKRVGAEDILGVGDTMITQIPEISSRRRRVDVRGIAEADVVLVPLEDGDRTEALRKMGKTVIAIDLNPLSRTAQLASITIVDNVVRALPILVREAKAMKNMDGATLQKLVSDFDNGQVLAMAIKHMNHRLSELAEKGANASLSFEEGV